jgi:hypothetical protein
LLAAAVDERIANGASDDVEVRLELITKVYRAKTIWHKKILSGHVSFEGKINPYKSAVSGKNDATTGNATAESKDDVNVASILHSGDDKSELTFDETFPKPLVFGFRAIVLKPRTGG